MFSGSYKGVLGEPARGLQDVRGGLLGLDRVVVDADGQGGVEEEAHHHEKKQKTPFGSARIREKCRKSQEGSSF